MPGLLSTLRENTAAYLKSLDFCYGIPVFTEKQKTLLQVINDVEMEVSPLSLMVMTMHATNAQNQIRKGPFRSLQFGKIVLAVHCFANLDMTGDEEASDIAEGIAWWIPRSGDAISPNTPIPVTDIAPFPHEKLGVYNTIFTIEGASIDSAPQRARYLYGTDGRILFNTDGTPLRGTDAP